MTRFAKLFLIAALAASPAMSFAQDVMKMSNDELSAYYKNEMSAIEDELKALGSMILGNILTRETCEFYTRSKDGSATGRELPRRGDLYLCSRLA